MTFRSAELEAERRRAELGHLPCASFDQPLPIHPQDGVCVGMGLGPDPQHMRHLARRRFEMWDTVRLARVRPTATIDDTDHGSVRVVVDIERDTPTHTRPRAVLTDPAGALVAAESVPMSDSETSSRSSSWTPASVAALVAANDGWPAAVPLTVTVIDAERRLVDEHASTIGFRSIELDTDPTRSARRSRWWSTACRSSPVA